MSKAYRLRKDRVMAAMAVLLIPVLFFCMCSRHSKKSKQANASAEAKPVAAATTVITQTTPVITTTAAAAVPQMAHISSPSCRAAAVYSINDDSMIYSDNIDEKTAPASLTKLLTASVALKYLDPDTVFTVGSEQALVQPYSSLAFLDVGSSLTVRDLITGMLMASGNDAAYALAASAAREMEPGVEMTDQAAINKFCGLMNSFAAEIGMKNSHFTTPDGWDDPDQYTTVSDLITLARYAVKLPVISQAAGTHQKTVEAFSGENYTWTNSNLLLDPDSVYYRREVTGLKTGTTLEAGNSLITVFEKNGKKYISAVAGCDTDEDRYDLTIKLIDAVK